MIIVTIKDTENRLKKQVKYINAKDAIDNLSEFYLKLMTPDQYEHKLAIFSTYYKNKSKSLEYVLYSTIINNPISLIQGKSVFLSKQLYEIRRNVITGSIRCEKCELDDNTDFQNHILEHNNKIKKPNFSFSLSYNGLDLKVDNNIESILSVISKIRSNELSSDKWIQVGIYNKLSVMNYKKTSQNRLYVMNQGYISVPIAVYNDLHQSSGQTRFGETFEMQTSVLHLLESPTLAALHDVFNDEINSKTYKEGVYMCKVNYQTGEIALENMNVDIGQLVKDSLSRQKQKSEN